MESILVTGGAGFIGSHTCISLLKKGYKVYILDSFVNSSRNVISSINKLYKSESISYSSNNLSLFEGDITNKSAIENVFSKARENGNPIKFVIHFAGLKSVKDSCFYPLNYWNVNVFGTINLLEVMYRNECKVIVFSSSATIYGLSKKKYIDESSEIKPINPYGNTKAVIEKILSDTFKYSNDWKIASLRYFNPIGAHSSGLLGENPVGIPNNIFPFINQVACKKEKRLKVFGKDWPTLDGTGVRDYIHVMDLAEAHVRTLEFMKSSKSQNLSLNIGTGKGTTVLELVHTFERINKIKIPYIIESRRNGDVARLVADNSLLKKKLNWFPKRSLEEMCKDGWKWQSLNLKGFEK